MPVIKSGDDLDAMLDTVKQAAIAYQDIAHLDTTAFKMIQTRNWSNAWQSQVVESLSELDKSIRSVIPLARELTSCLNVTLDELSLETLSRANDLASLVEISSEQSMGYLFGKGVKETLKELEQLRDDRESLDKTFEEIGHDITVERLAKTPVEEWVARAESGQSNWFKRLLARWKINSAAKKLGYAKFKDLSSILQFRLAFTLYQSISRVAPKFESDAIWKGWSTSSADLSQSSHRSQQGFEQLSRIMVIADDPSQLLTSLKAQLAEGRDFLDNSKLMQHARAFKEKWARYEACMEQAQTLKLSIALDRDLERLQSQIVSLIDNSPRFKPWSEWLLAVNRLEAYDLGGLSEGLIAGTVIPEDAEDAVYTGFCRWLAPQLIDGSDVLRMFKASSHEQLLIDFRELDKDVAHTTSEYIAAIAAAKVPDPYSEESSKEFGLLARELQKKTRHKPIRSLINDMGQKLLDLCPCLMMSPLSVAQFLPSTFNGFDLVVFDEASQITTWDSVGAIARGRNVIVVGDPKQMPPTNFFGSSASSDNPDEEDLESILDQALAARLPHRRLNGHYRSRHETLIAFSNNKYYDNQLVTYPSCDTKESAVTLHRVEGVYAKGKGRNNAIEARAVVDEIIRRLLSKDYQHQTIGVVTLNSEQQRMVEDLLDDARRKHPQIETFFHSTDDYDGVFVKNLESVQGDERDVIILSLGYGPVVPGGNTMSMNFGPLNKQGGERRLNVAITRAKSEVLVFSSFDSSMIDLSRTSAIAVEHLKHYLEFAEKGPVALAQQSTAAYGVDQFDSDFEQAVAFALRDKGWQVQTQIGVSKFRVDLGVLHPDRPGTYLAGVECDGATYHGSPSARDRDRVRHIILEGLGWRLIRLWSTDYFQDPDTAIDRIDMRLKEILEHDKQDSLQQEIDDQTSVEEPSLEDQEPMISDADNQDDSDEESDIGSEYDHRRYFDQGHQATLLQLVRDILSEKNGVTFHELVLDIANLHGLSRTSKKQLTYLMSIIEPFAGIQRIEGQKTVVWASPDDIQPEIPWRGLEAFGPERNWSDVPYPEALGLARQAIASQPQDPVDYLCNEFKLKRRHDTTLKRFGEWISAVKESSL